MEEIDRYYAKMFELDAVTLNNDRHMNNICVIRNIDKKGLNMVPFSTTETLLHYHMKMFKNGKMVKAYRILLDRLKENRSLPISIHKEKSSKMARWN